MRLLDPWVLLLLLIVPLYLFRVALRRGHRRAVRYSSDFAATDLPASWRSRLSGLPTVLKLLALVCVILGLSRPVIGRQAVKTPTQGIAIEMVIDRSGSMRSMMDYHGHKESRLAVVKRVFRDFVDGTGKHLKGRPNDLIGLVTFARYADTICPLTLDHATLDAFLKQIHPPVDPRLDGTAIGDGIALAAAHLEALGSKAAGGRYHVKSKIIILLTDGQNNFGRYSPTQAARLAKRWGIPVYTIGIGNPASTVTVNTIFGPQRVPGSSALNEGILKKIATMTGGTFQIATSGKSLEAVYHRIDKLQKSTLKRVSYVDWRELYLPLVLAAFGALFVGVAAEHTLLRRLP